MYYILLASSGAHLADISKTVYFIIVYIVFYLQWATDGRTRILICNYLICFNMFASVLACNCHDRCVIFCLIWSSSNIICNYPLRNIIFVIHLHHFLQSEIITKSTSDNLDVIAIEYHFFVFIPTFVTYLNILWISRQLYLI